MYLPTPTYTHKTTQQLPAAAAAAMADVKSLFGKKKKVAATKAKAEPPKP